MAVLIRKDNNPNNLRYFVYDHQGSIDTILNNSGGVHMHQSFAAFGERRDPTDWVGPPSTSDETLIGNTSDMGYTGHDHLEKSSLIHMRGRVADSLTGRFLSPDPYVPNPGNTQSFNRYSYVNNRPMSFTDPSGFCNEDTHGPIICYGSQIGLGIIFDSISFRSSAKAPPQPKMCFVTGPGCYGPATKPSIYDVVNDIAKLVKVVRNPRSLLGSWGIGVTFGGGFGGIGSGRFGTGSCPENFGPYCMSWDGDTIWEFGEEGKYEGIESDRYYRLMRILMSDLLSGINYSRENKNTRDYAEGGGFLNIERRMFGDPKISSNFDPGNDELATDYIDERRARPRFTIGAVVITPSDNIDGLVNSLAEHSNYLKAPIFVYTSERFYNGRFTAVRTMDAYRIAGGPEGQISCTNLSTGESCN